VVTTQQESGGASSMFNPSGTITMTSSADYLYPSGGWHLKPGQACEDVRGWQT